MPKLLGEFLQEQQEPFALDVYLLERGYSKGTNLYASSRIRNSTSFLKKPHPIPNCSKFVKAVFSRLVLHNYQKIKNSRNGGRKNTQVDNRESGEEHGDEDIFSSASGTTVYNSCSESDVEDTESSENGNLEAEAERELKWRSMEDGNKQLSPVSVLEETEADEESPPHEGAIHSRGSKSEDIMFKRNTKIALFCGEKLSTEQYNFKTTQGESSTSVSQCKSTHNSVQELQELVDSNSYAQYIINKRALQQTKQLLIDCVREVIESHRRKDDKNGQQLKKILGADALWKLVCDDVWLWSQDSIDETNIVHLLHYDFMASAEEWSSAFEQQREEISMEIGDAILEGIINEIVKS